MGRFSVVLPSFGSLYQGVELVSILSRCVADWEVSEAYEPRRKVFGSMISGEKFGLDKVSATTLSTPGT